MELLFMRNDSVILEHINNKIDQAVLCKQLKLTFSLLYYNILQSATIKVLLQYNFHEEQSALLSAPLNINNCNFAM